MGFRKLQRKNNITNSLANTITNSLANTITNSLANTNTNDNDNDNDKSFKINGLIFDSEEDYNKLKNIDNNIINIVQLVKNGIIDINDVFKSIDTIYVEETYPDAYDEVDGLFINATSLLVYEDTPYDIEYKVACKFFDKIDVIDYEEIYT